MFERECDQNLFEKLAEALELRTEEGLDSLFDALQDWKRDNRATMAAAQSPTCSWGSQANKKSPTAAIFRAMENADQGDWTALEEIYSEWSAAVADSFEQERDWTTLDELGSRLPD